MKFVVLLLFTAMLIIPVSTSNPLIDTWYNNKTNDNTQDLAIYINETVKFNVTANQSIDVWNWTKDGVMQNHNYDNFSISWDYEGVKTLSVNATNNTNTSNTIIWNVTVLEEETEFVNPEITSWYNNKTNDAGLNIIINTNETIKFDVTANQVIDTWNWSKDGVMQNHNCDNFSISWDYGGVKTLSVNATNNTNTSNTITWNVTVLEEVTEFVNPEITSWYNDKTNDAGLNIMINTNETIKFDVTANQVIDTWNWSNNDVDVEDNNYDNFTTYWEDPGIKNVSVNAINSNGSDTITWKVTVQKQQRYQENDIILFSSPQVVDYVYVNDTITETITYSITTAESLENIS